MISRFFISFSSPGSGFSRMLRAYRLLQAAAAIRSSSSFFILPIPFPAGLCYHTRQKKERALHLYSFALWPVLSGGDPPVPHTAGPGHFMKKAKKK